MDYEKDIEFVVVADGDGVLGHTEPDATHAFRHTLEVHGGDSELIRSGRISHLLLEQRGSFAQRLSRCVSRGRAKSTGSPRDTFEKKFTERCSGGIQICRGAKTGIRQLPPQARIIVATRNKPEFYEELLERHGLQNKVEAVVAPAKFGASKADSVEAALRQRGLDQKRAPHIPRILLGDSPDEVEVARKIDAVPIAMATDSSYVPRSALEGQGFRDVCVDYTAAVNAICDVLGDHLKTAPKAIAQILELMNQLGDRGTTLLQGTLAELERYQALAKC